MAYEVLAIGWLGMAVVFGLASALIAPRWGRDPFGWTLIGAVLGPLGLLLLVAMHWDDLKRPAAYVIQPAMGPPGEGERRVLLLADRSASGLRAAQYVIDRYGRTAQEVGLVGVLPLERANGLRSPEGSARRDLLEAGFNELVGPSRERLSAAGLPVRTIMAFGDPSNQIARLAEDRDYGVIVLGRERGGLAAIIGGAASRKVARVAGRSVIVVDGHQQALARG